MVVLFDNDKMEAAPQSCEMFQPPAAIQDEAHCNSMDAYKQLYQQSIDDPSKFWGDVAKQFYWKEKPVEEKPLLDFNFDKSKGNVYIKFMEGWKTNICYNMLDRNIKDKNMGDTVAFYW